MNWIKIGEKYPEENEYVLAVDNGDIYMLQYAVDDKGIMHFWDVDGVYTKHNVTHWMPLPEPPK